ncbi:hypothetical protein EON63_18140 [archaeon]|nr:MAG: hypothetical protein EON63_18140 [archaeon]
MHTVNTSHSHIYEYMLQVRTHITTYTYPYTYIGAQHANRQHLLSDGGAGADQKDTPRRGGRRERE